MTGLLTRILEALGGATRLASLLKRERAKADRVLHVDSGDAFQGAPIFNLKLGEAEYKFLSQVGLNAAVIGNHEFRPNPRSARDSRSLSTNTPA